MEKAIKRLLFCVMMMCFALVADAQTKTMNYVVEYGETLYLIAQRHGLTLDEIYKANPGLTEKILAGQTIKIPVKGTTNQAKETTTTSTPSQVGQTTATTIKAQSVTPAKTTTAQVQQKAPVKTTSVFVPKIPNCKTTYTVKKNDTFEGIAAQFGVTVDDLKAANPTLGKKLKKDTDLCIPYTQKEIVELRQRLEKEEEARRLDSIKNSIKHYGVLKVAVIAPFALEETHRSLEAQKITDFYKGFLLAADTLKHLESISTDVYAFEEVGTDGITINSVLDNPNLKKMNLIIGPFRPENAAKVAEFAAEHNITMVTPMSTKSVDLTNYSNLYEVSAPQWYTFKHVYSTFIEHYNDYNIIILKMTGQSESTEFIAGMKNSLTKNGIPFKTMDISAINTLPDSLTAGKNMIIPTSSSEATLTTIFQKFKFIGAKLTPFNIRLFGYPSWQTYTAHKANLCKYNSVFYTTFFANPQSERVQRFNNTFTKWFHYAQVKSFPSYGILGYDIGMYFLRGLHEYGSSFTYNSPSVYTGMQTNFKFSPVNGDQTNVNIGVIFVRFNQDGNFIVTR